LSFGIAAPQQFLGKKLISLDFVMNLPEAKRVPPYTDARPEIIVVPADYPLDHRYIPADRSIKRSTLVAAIAADGTGLKPLIIVPRLTIERALYFWGYEVTKVIFEYQEHDYDTTFEDWVNKVLLPYHVEQRELTNHTGWGLFILDSCTCHSLISLEGKLRENKIVLITHSSARSERL
jgi:hypothetical protein